MKWVLHTNKGGTATYLTLVPFELLTQIESEELFICSSYLQSVEQLELYDEGLCKDMDYINQNNALFFALVPNPQERTFIRLVVKENKPQIAAEWRIL